MISLRLDDKNPIFHRICLSMRKLGYCCFHYSRNSDKHIDKEPERARHYSTHIIPTPHSLMIIHTYSQRRTHQSFILIIMTLGFEILVHLLNIPVCQDMNGEVGRDGR